MRIKISALCMGVASVLAMVAIGGGAKEIVQ